MGGPWRMYWLVSLAAATSGFVAAPAEPVEPVTELDWSGFVVSVASGDPEEVETSAPAVPEAVALTRAGEGVGSYGSSGSVADRAPVADEVLGVSVVAELALAVADDAALAVAGDAALAAVADTALAVADDAALAAVADTALAVADDAALAVVADAALAVADDAAATIDGAAAPVVGGAEQPAQEPAAAAPATVSAPGYVQRGQALLARIPVSPASIGYTVEFKPPRPGFRGLTWPSERRIDIYVGDDISDAHLLHVIAHEIGHAVDLARNSVEDRRAWRAARGMAADAAWWPAAYASDFHSPAGDFAECFARWAVGSYHNRSQYGTCAGTESLISSLATG